MLLVMVVSLVLNTNLVVFSLVQLSTVISGLNSAPINRPHLLIFKRKKKLYINKPRLSISRRCPRDCGQASRHSRLCGQISRHGNSTAPIILTFTVNTSKPLRREAPRYATLRYATLCYATPWSATLRCAVKRSFRRRVYFLRSPRAYRARKHTEKWAVCVITERNRRMTGVGKCASGVNSQAPAL